MQSVVEQQALDDLAAEALDLRHRDKVGRRGAPITKKDNQLRPARDRARGGGNIPNRGRETR